MPANWDDVPDSIKYASENGWYIRMQQLKRSVACAGRAPWEDFLWCSHPVAIWGPGSLRRNGLLPLRVA